MKRFFLFFLLLMCVTSTSVAGAGDTLVVRTSGKTFFTVRNLAWNEFLLKAGSLLDSSRATEAVKMQQILPLLEAAPVSPVFSILETRADSGGTVSVTFQISIASFRLAFLWWKNQHLSSLRLAEQLEARNLPAQAYARQFRAWLIEEAFSIGSFRSATHGVLKTYAALQGPDTVFVQTATDAFITEFIWRARGLTSTPHSVFLTAGNEAIRLLATDSSYSGKIQRPFSAGTPGSIAVFPFNPDEWAGKPERFLLGSVDPDRIPAIRKPVFFVHKQYAQKKPVDPLLLKRTETRIVIPDWLARFTGSQTPHADFVAWLRKGNKDGTLLFASSDAPFSDRLRCFVIISDPKGSVQTLLQPLEVGFLRLDNGEKLQDLNSFKGKAAIWVQKIR